MAVVIGNGAVFHTAHYVSGNLTRQAEIDRLVALLDVTPVGTPERRDIKQALFPLLYNTGHIEITSTEET